MGCFLLRRIAMHDVVDELEVKESRRSTTSTVAGLGDESADTKWLVWKLAVYAKAAWHVRACGWIGSHDTASARQAHLKRAKLSPNPHICHLKYPVFNPPIWHCYCISSRAGRSGAKLTEVSYHSRATCHSGGKTHLDLDGEEEVTSRKKTFIKRAIAFIKNRRRANRVTRNHITRDRYGAHDRLVAAFFSEEPMYDEVKFRKTFRMARPLFNEIVTAVIDHDPFFCNNFDCTGKEGISGLLKCISAICQLAYGVHAEFLDEYMQISERSSHLALGHFCESVMQIYGPEYLRKPTFACPYAFKAQYVRRDHGPNPFILLEAVASQDLWIWHAFFGVAGSNNDINVLYQSPLFNDLKTGRAPEIPFVANGVTYPSGYYLVDGIYPELAPLVKTIPEPADDDHKRILYKQKQESARKDVERAFGVLKKKWVILANPTRALKKERIINMMYTCIILHNMIRKYKKYAISPKWFSEEMHQPDDPLQNEEQVQQVMRWIRSAQAHQNLRHDLIEHLSRNA
ncbi:ALP1-like protein [Tanacetum coccineum]